MIDGPGQHLTPRMILSASFMPGIREPFAAHHPLAFFAFRRSAMATYFASVPSGMANVTGPVPFWTDSKGSRAPARAGDNRAKARQEA